MGYELDRLLERYGVANAAPVTYGGPGASAVSETDYQAAQNLYNEYLKEYRRRVSTQPMYGDYYHYDPLLQGPKYGTYGTSGPTAPTAPTGPRPPGGGGPTGGPGPTGDPFIPPPPPPPPGPTGETGEPPPGPTGETLPYSPDPEYPEIPPFPPSPTGEPEPPGGTVIVGDPWVVDPGTGHTGPVDITGPTAEPEPPGGTVVVGDPVIVDDNTPGWIYDEPTPYSPPPSYPEIPPFEPEPPGGTVVVGDPVIVDDNTPGWIYDEPTPYSPEPDYPEIPESPPPEPFPEEFPDSGGGYPETPGGDGGGYPEPDLGTGDNWDWGDSWDNWDWGGGGAGGSWRDREPTNMLAAKGGRVKTHFADGGLNQLVTDYNLYSDPMMRLPSVYSPELVQMLARNTPQAPAPAAQAAAPEQAAPAPGFNMEDMLARVNKMSAANTFGPQIEAAQKSYRSESDLLNRMMLQASEQSRAKMDPAEMWFRLAKAFATPTRTGSFSESLGLAGGEAAAMLKEQRESDLAEQAARRQLMLQAQQAKVTAAGQELAGLRPLALEESKERFGLVKEALKEYIKSGEPVSEAGKAAADLGLKKGTAEYNKFVSNYVGTILDKKQAEIAASMGRAEAVAANIGAAQAKLELAQAREKKLSPTEVGLKAKTGTELNAAKQTLGVLNEAMGLVDNAFTASVGDKLQRQFYSTTQPSSKKVKDTEKFENLLTQSALDSLRATFGGNPTEGERAIQLATRGLNATSAESRKSILKQLADKIQTQIAQKQAEFDAISSGAYGEKQ